MAITYHAHFFCRSTGTKIDEGRSGEDPASVQSYAAYHQRYNPDLWVRVCRKAADGSEVYLDTVNPRLAEVEAEEWDERSEPME